MANVGFLRHCRDGHRCEFGSTCLQDPNEEGSYYCDCSTANGDYVGLFCEYEADNYCTFPQETTSSWFCTNRGTCVIDVNKSNGSDEFSCDCPDDYEGPHCEFIKGALPDDWPGASALEDAKAKKEEEDGLKIGVTIAIVIVAVIIVALLGYIVNKKLRGDSSGKVDQNAPKDHSEALQLDADGSALQEAVNSMNSSQQNSLTPSTNGLHDDGSVEVGPADEHMNGNGHSHMNGGGQSLI